MYHYCVRHFTVSTKQCRVSDLLTEYRCSLMKSGKSLLSNIIMFLKWELQELAPTASKKDAGFKRDIVVILAQPKITDA